MIVVTGGAGFIGANLVAALNRRGVGEVLVVDDLTDGTKFRNIADCEIADYLDRDEYLRALERGAGTAGSVEAVFHQGACTNTCRWKYNAYEARETSTGDVAPVEFNPTDVPVALLEEETRPGELMRVIQPKRGHGDSPVARWSLIIVDTVGAQQFAYFVCFIIGHATQRE